MRVFAFILAIIMCLVAFAGCGKKEKEDLGKDTQNDRVTTEENTPDEKDTEKNEDTENVGGGDSGKGEDSASGSEETTAPSESAKDEETNISDTEKEDTKSEENKSETQKAENTTEETKKEDDRETDTPSQTYTDGLVLEAYLSVVGSHFSKNYKEGDSLNDYDVLHLTALTLLTHNSDSVMNLDDSEEYFYVEASELEKAMQLLFGEKATLERQKKYMDESLGDKIDKDKYIFSRNRNGWGGGSYYLDFDSPMKIKETDSAITAETVLTNEKGKTIKITYSFEKVVDDGYLYFRLTKAKVK